MFNLSGQLELVPTLFEWQGKDRLFSGADLFVPWTFNESNRISAELIHPYKPASYTCFLSDSGILILYEQHRVKRRFEKDKLW